jgi:hypothetical protein
LSCRIRGIQTKCFPARLNLLLDPRFKAFLVNRRGGNVSCQRSRHHHHTVAVSDNNVIWDDRHITAADRHL